MFERSYPPPSDATFGKSYPTPHPPPPPPPPPPPSCPWLLLKVWSLGWRSIWLHIEELYADWRISNQRISRSADLRTIFRLQNYLQLEELFADRRIVYKPKKYWICGLKNCLQIEKLFADERIFCRLNGYSIGR